MNVFAAAATELESRRSRRRARDRRPPESTLYEVLLAGVGVPAGPLAYWEHRRAHDLVRAVRQVVETRVGPLERWALDTGRTWDDLAALLGELGGDTDSDAEGAALTPLDPPARLRPWVRPEVAATTRIPFVPFGAIAAVALATPDRPVADALADAGVTAQMNALEVLDRLDPAIDDGSGSAPDGVAELAERLRAAWRAGSSALGPATVAVRAAEHYGGTPAELDAALAAAVAAHEEAVRAYRSAISELRAVLAGPGELIPDAD